jgi:hypothetical protein
MKWGNDLFIFYDNLILYTTMKNAYIKFLKGGIM